MYDQLHSSLLTIRSLQFETDQKKPPLNQSNQPNTQQESISQFGQRENNRFTRIKYL